MSKRKSDVFYIEHEPAAKCENCGKLAELRPYGKNGANVCFECAMIDEDNAIEMFNKRMSSAKTVRVVKG